MRKIVRLTESDLIRLVKRVIKEQENKGGFFYDGQSGEELDKMLDDFRQKQLKGQPEKRFTMKMKPGTKGILGHKDSWFDEFDRPVDPEEFEHDEEVEFGPDDFEEYISQTEKDFPENKWSFRDKDMYGERTPGKKYYDRYTKDGPIKLRRKKF